MAGMAMFFKTRCSAVIGVGLFCKTYGAATTAVGRVAKMMDWHLLHRKLLKHFFAGKSAGFPFFAATDFLPALERRVRPQTRAAAV